MEGNLERNLVTDSAKIEQLSFALTAAGIGTWDLDPINGVVNWDMQCRQLFGLDNDAEVDYETVIDHIHPDDAQMVNNAVQKALDPSTKNEYEVRYRTRSQNGNLIWVLSKGRAYFNDENIAYRFAGTAQNISSVVADHEKLLESEKIAQVAMENSNSGYFRISLTDNEMEYSPGYSSILTGDKSTNLKRSDFVRHVHPDDLPQRSEAFKKAEETGALEYESRVVWKDGSVHWMRAKGTYLYDNSGKPVFLTGTIYDTTAEHQKEDTLKEAERLLGSAFTDASLGMAFADLNGNFIKANAAYLSLLGYSENELYAINYKHLTHPEDKEKCDRLFEDLVNAKISYFAVDKRYLKKDGKYTWVQLNVTYVAGINNEEPRVMAIIRDIDAEIQNQFALSISQAILKNVSNSAPTGLWLSDENGLLTYLNKTLVDWTGMAYEELLGAGWANAIIEEDRQKGVEAFQNAIAARAHYDVIFRIKKHDKSTIWCRAAGDPFYEEYGSFAGYAGFCMDMQELMSGQEALQKSDSQFRSLIAAAPAGIGLFVGRDLIIRHPNKTFIDIVGKGPDIEGLPLREAMPELLTEGQPFLKILDDVYTSGVMFQSYGSQVKIVQNGLMSYNYYNITYTPIFDENNEVFAILDIAIDVTGEIEARKELEESELFSRSVIEHSPIAKLVFTGPDMVIKTANEKMLNLMGKDASIIGKPFEYTAPQFNDSPFKKRLLTVLETGETYTQPEEKLEGTKNGHPYIGYYNYIFKALKNVSGERYGIMVTATEITDQVLARLKIEEAEIKLRGAVDLAELGTWDIELGSGKLEYSDRLRAWFGIGLEELITPEKAYSVVHPDDRKRVEECFANATAPGSDGVYNIEYRVNPKETGSKKTLHVSGKTFFNDKGIAIKINGTAQDVTIQRATQLGLEQEVQERTEELAAAIEELRCTNEELGESNEKLSQSNEELSQYAYVASHDLQEPLRKIMFFSNLLNDKKTILPEQQKWVNKIISSSQRMSKLISDLLDFSRLQHSDKGKVMMNVDLNDLLQEVVADFELIITEKAATVNVSRLPALHAVKLQMNQLFYNLLSNSLKFTDQNISPVIDISCVEMERSEVLKYYSKVSKDTPYYHLQFADNGIGFETQFIDHIFEPFKRLHGKDVFPGSGIGLAVCRKIVAQHGGHMFAEAVPGKGSVFHIILAGKI